MDIKKMKKLNVAFYISSSKKVGGGFQYEFKAVSLLLNSNFNDINILVLSDIRNVVKEYDEMGIEIIFMKYRQEDDSLITMEDFLIRNSIDLIYFLTPTTKAKELINIPYVMTVWDLCHRDFNEFPEVRNNYEFEKREERYTTLLKKAIKITTDSELGKKNICYRYGIDEKRVEVLKFLPRDMAIEKVIDIRTKYNITNKYIYYPAQFWAHKNHIYILKALHLLKLEYDLIIDVIFTGTDYGNLEYILEKAQEYSIETQIHYLGFVEDEEIPNLYKQSIALVMPTYFGPTNIPPLEAFLLGIPVCYSDLDGLREQVGEAAFLIDLRNPYSLVNHIITIINDKETVNNKVNLGYEIINSWTESDFINVIYNILNEYKTIRECWR
ncbi:MAG: glycosyltransferase family 1 protein [Arcobacteraceae bacterium]|nr:glycosyltransferase family 1 protein [Arcobacteraceae bacterium]